MLTDWYANIDEVRSRIGWGPRTSFREGIVKTAEWFQGLENKEKYVQSSKRFGLDTKHSVSAVIACYKDNEAIPVMYERLKETFTKLNVDYEIIFVNDGSPDNSEEVIRAISRNDRRVRGISHSRNFGSQAGFRSGMEISTKNSCVLLDGDLQDPPELIEADGEEVARRVRCCLWPPRRTASNCSYANQPTRHFTGSLIISPTFRSHTMQATFRSWIGALSTLC